jgi:hypothetical protein
LENSAKTLNCSWIYSSSLFLKFAREERLSNYK